MAKDDVKKEKTGKFVKSSGENHVPPLENVGSTEFYQGKKQLEEVDIPPALKKSVKVEMVRKEEIYQDKMVKHAEFITSLGKKKEAEEKAENDEPDHVAENISLGKKIFFAILSLVVLAMLVGGGYSWRLKKPAANPAGENKNVVVIPVNSETAPDNSAEERNQTAEVAPADMSVKVLNEGAAAGSAGRIKTVLISQGYAKTEAGNGQEESVVGSTVYYSGEQSKKAASAIGELLVTNKIKSEVKEALTAEQKGADVVVVLGK